MAHAHGKVILLGEHAVVYGQPALAGALDRGCEVVVESHPEGPFLVLGNQRFLPGAEDPVARAFAIALSATALGKEQIAARVVFDIPTGAGLGSSAALAVALCRALYAFANKLLDDQTLDTQAHDIERLFHGKPSGLDAHLARTGAIGLYTRGAGLEPVACSPFKVIIVDSGISRSTEKQVVKVAKRHERLKATTHVMTAIGELARAGGAALEQGELGTLGELMNMNHGLLSALGVSHPALDAVVHLARAEGALGAKLTGAGGGGCAVVLAPGGEVAMAQVLAPISRSVTIATLGAA